MIVVDTNVIAYLYLATEFTRAAEELLEHDADWAAPILWRSELRNVLALYLRRKVLNLEEAYVVQTEAESLMVEREYEIDSLEVLRLADSSGCAAYDCEFVALAAYLGVPFVTMDKEVLRRFRSVAVSLRNAVR